MYCTDRCRLHQLYLNWLLTFLSGINMTIGYSIVYPTLHNFIVNPANESCVSIILHFVIIIICFHAWIYFFIL